MNEYIDILKNLIGYNVKGVAKSMGYISPTPCDVGNAMQKLISEITYLKDNPNKGRDFIHFEVKTVKGKLKKNGDIRLLGDINIGSSKDDKNFKYTETNFFLKLSQIVFIIYDDKDIIFDIRYLNINKSKYKNIIKNEFISILPLIDEMNDRELDDVSLLGYNMEDYRKDFITIKPKRKSNIYLKSNVFQELTKSIGSEELKERSEENTIERINIWVDNANYYKMMIKIIQNTDFFNNMLEKFKYNYKLVEI